MDRKILNTLEANDLLRDVAKHLDTTDLKSWKQVADFVMLSVEYIPELMFSLEVLTMERPCLLWFPDKKDQSVDDLVVRTIAEFQKRFDRYPNLLMINPQTAEGLESFDFTVRDIEVSITNAILPGRVWVGIDERVKPDPVLYTSGYGVVGIRRAIGLLWYRTVGEFLLRIGVIHDDK